MQNNLQSKFLNGRVYSLGYQQCNECFTEMSRKVYVILNFKRFKSILRAFEY